MFGFPSELELSFLEAWKEPFTGFELRWLEVEICRQAMIASSVTDLFEKMKARYPDLLSMHQSKFYRTVNSLEDAGYLESKNEGRAKVMQTTPEGSKELGRITRYFFEIQMERMKSALFLDVMEKITSPLGDLLEQQVLVLGPEYSTINIIIKESLRLFPKKDVDDISSYQQLFVYLDFNGVVTGRTDHSSIETISKIDDWPYKAGAKGDLAILFTTLSSYPEEAVKILKEAKRVVGPKGKIVLFELTRRDSRLITTIMREATMLINFSNPSSTWKMPDVLPANKQIIEWIELAELTIDHEFPDIISSVYIVS